ncbi:MAG: hypothetical protein CVV17_08700, partial [Gammaproteobacteria bacterium HGW-Gammaproteobacteria-7]
DHAGLAERVLAGADAAHLVALDHECGAGGSGQCFEQRVYRAIAGGAATQGGAAGIADLHRRRRPRAFAGTGADVECLQAPAIDTLAIVRGQQRFQVGIEDFLLLFGQGLELCEQSAERGVIEHVAEKREALDQCGAATVAAQHHLRAIHADIFGTDDFVGVAMAQHAVLMDTRFVRERVGANDGLVALHLHASQTGEQARGRHQPAAIDTGVAAVHFRTHLERHYQFFQRAVAGALADAVDGAFHLHRAAFDRGQGVGHRHAQIVVAMRAEDGLIGIGDGAAQVFEQGEGASTNTLLETFRDSPRAVLLGTRAFWEGVDIPGEALSVLVIVKLPFDVPSDPIIAARAETFDDAFNEYNLPEAILKFRQGFGRLIRTQSDRGVVVILDKRVLTKKYGRQFIESLPVCTTKVGTVVDLPRA